jgi:hypothetical protein
MGGMMVEESREDPRGGCYMPRSIGRDVVVSVRNGNFGRTAVSSLFTCRCRMAHEHVWKKQRSMWDRNERVSREVFTCACGVRGSPSFKVRRGCKNRAMVAAAGRDQACGLGW